MFALLNRSSYGTTAYSNVFIGSAQRNRVWFRLIALCTSILFGVLCCFQHCAGYFMTGSFVGRGNQYIQLVKVLYCKLPTSDKQLTNFPS